MLTAYSYNEAINTDIHFLHGNSMTPNSYKNILDGLSNTFNVKTSILRPLWKNNDFVDFSNWDIFLEDYLDSIKNEEKITGVGHSIGGNILLKSAMLNPDKFEKIILLDPTFFPPYTIYAWRMISFFKVQSYFLAYIKNAENKKMQYSSIEDMFNSYRRYKIFSRFSDEDLLLFVNSLIFEKDGKVNLIFDSRWDAHIYRTGLVNDMFIWKNIQKLKTKTFIIRAEYSDVFYKKTSKLVLKRNSDIKIETLIGADHLFPINNSANTLKLIENFINT